MKKVFMEMKMQVMEEVRKEDIKSVGFGSFRFQIEGKEVVFYFIEYRIAVNQPSSQGFLELCYKTSSDGIGDISGIYDEDYRAMGLERECITAEFLSSASEILDINIECYKEHEEINRILDIKIESICFTDENGKRYEVSQEVITEYNEKTSKQGGLANEC